MKRISIATGILLLVTLSVAAQTEITEKQFIDVEKKSEEFLKTSSHRLTRKLEYLEDRSRESRVRENFLEEVLLPNKRRTVEEKFYDQPTRTERIWDGKVLYEKENDKQWKRYDGYGEGINSWIETGQKTYSYKYLGKTEINGRQIDLYEVQEDRIARKMTRTDTFIVHYVRHTRFWFGADGRLLKKIEENEIEGRNDMSRETTIVDYDTTIKIEAPIS